MIVVNVQKDRITVSGHAEYAEPGRDIVCAAISTLSQVFVASVEELTAARIKYAVSGGEADIDLQESTERAQVLLDAFVLGCQMVADEYPEYVRVF